MLFRVRIKLKLLEFCAGLFLIKATGAQIGLCLRSTTAHLLRHTVCFAVTCTSGE